MMFYKRLAELRKEAGLTQKEFAAKKNIELSKYNKWENGKAIPDLDTIWYLAGEFDVTLDYLVGKSEFRNLEDEYKIERAFQDTIRALSSAIGSEEAQRFVDAIHKVLADNLFGQVNTTTLFVGVVGESDILLSRADEVAQKVARMATITIGSQMAI